MFNRKDFWQGVIDSIEATPEHLHFLCHKIECAPLHPSVRTEELEIFRELFGPEPTDEERSYLECNVYWNETPSTYENNILHNNKYRLMAAVIMRDYFDEFK